MRKNEYDLEAVRAGIYFLASDRIRYTQYVRIPAPNASDAVVNSSDFYCSGGKRSIHLKSLLRALRDVDVHS